MARCLNSRGGGHENPDNAICCRQCDFLVQGAHIGIYEVIAFIGAGSYGYVYKVREPMPLSRMLALKVLRLDQLTDKAQAGFFQEARRIAAMQHPNILPVYSFGQIEENEQPYFVMEYAPQTILDLFRQADGTRRLAFVEELIPYVQQIASALQYIHNNGLIHQDVKPGNLLIGRRGQVLLADFGTTFYLGKQTHASVDQVTGTAAYMPLEQWQGQPRRDTDQYALATCCYELLAGRPPFQYKRLEEMWHAHMHEVLPAPQQWNARIPVEVSAVLQRALSKDYRQRYYSISAFADHYIEAVTKAQQRHLCQQCGQQNRTGAQRCASCGIEYDSRCCLYCDTQVRFGQRCCSLCGRLTIPAALVSHSPLEGVSLRQGRYTIKHVIKRSEETHIMVAIACDAQANERKVFLKRWECSDSPLTQRAKELSHYERVTTPLASLRHPLLPTVVDRFAEGRYYYVITTYIDGESIEERLQKCLYPLPERDVISYMNAMLNVLIMFEQQRPPMRPYDLSPANILIEAQRGRVFLTSLQVPPPPNTIHAARAASRVPTTRNLAISPYLPIQDKPFDQRTCIYALAATMHHAVTNIAPPHYPSYPPVRQLNPAISPALETVLARALTEDISARYQSYEQMKKDIQRLLSSSQ